MKKDLTKAIALFVILLAVHHLIIFVLPFKHNAAFWVSYLFTLIAFAGLAGANYIAFTKTKNIKSRFYGFPIAKVGVIYFIVQIIASYVCMTVSKVPANIEVLIYGVFLALAAIGLIAADTAREIVQDRDVKLKTEVTVMRTLQSQTNQLIGQTSGVTQQILQKFAENLRYSDPVSSESLDDVENDLQALVCEIQQAVVDGDNNAVVTLCRKAEAVLAERNRLCKLGK